MTAVRELSTENAKDYLTELGVLPPASDARIEELGWGVSNIVLRVETGADCFVMKQSLAKLRVKDDWPFDRSRIFIERDCMIVLDELLPGAAPRVRFSDDANFVFGMSCAPAQGQLWKKILLEGDTTPRHSEMAGALLGQMHRRGADHPATRTRFASQQNFLEGRIDPYHWTTAKAHPDLAPLIRAEVERMLAHRVTLVHGDYSPKNLFIYPDRVLMLDFEVAHFGDPAFDVAFCLTHLLLKAIKFPQRRAAYLNCSRGFFRAHQTEMQLDPSLEDNTIRELGCLLLARIDGKSKEDYITEEHEREAARQLGRRLLVAPPETIESVWELLS